MTRSRGFTIIELMVTLSIAALLVLIGVPAFSSFVQNNRITSTTNFVVAQLHYARAEAIRLNLPVNLARTGGTAGELADGWRIYSDAGSATGNSAYSATDGDTLLREFEGYDGANISVAVSNVGNQWIAFNPTGLLSEGGTTVEIAVCDDRGLDFGRLISISTTGRTRVTSSSDADNPLTDCNP